MFIKDLKCIFSDRKLIILLLFVILTGFAGVFFSVNRENEPVIRMGIADNDNSEYSHLLVNYFDENENFTSYISVVRASETELDGMFYSGDIDLYIIIPENFSQNLKVIQNETIKVVINSYDTTKSVLMTNLLDAYAAYISSVQVNCQALLDLMRDEGYPQEERKAVNREVSIDLVFTALGSDSYFNKSEMDRINGISLINYYIYSVIVLIILYGGMFAGMAALKERLGKAGARMRSVGVSGVSIFFSRLAAYSLVYSVVMIIMMIVTGTMGQINIPAVSILASVPTIIASVIIFTLISRFSTSVNSYTIVSNMLILLMTISGGGIIPIMYLPEVCVKVACFTPTYWFLRLVC